MRTSWVNDARKLYFWSVLVLGKLTDRQAEVLAFLPNIQKYSASFQKILFAYDCHKCIDKYIPLRDKNFYKSDFRYTRLIDSHASASLLILNAELSSPVSLAGREQGSISPASFLPVVSGNPFEEILSLRWMPDNKCRACQHLVDAQ